MKEFDVSTWSEEMKYRFSERAGIREFDGGETREQAEADARREIWGQRWQI